MLLPLLNEYLASVSKEPILLMLDIDGNFGCSKELDNLVRWLGHSEEVAKLFDFIEPLVGSGCVLSASWSPVCLILLSDSFGVIGCCFQSLCDLSLFFIVGIRYLTHWNYASLVTPIILRAICAHEI